MTAVTQAGALSHNALNWYALDRLAAHRIVRRLQAHIVKATPQWCNRVSFARRYQGLEPDAGELSCPVLRGLGGSNPARLPGMRTPFAPAPAPTLEN